MSDRGWCPFARQHRGPGREGPFGYPAGARDQNHPLIFVTHRMGGFKRTLDDDAWRHANWVGVTAGIGRDGSLDQYCNLFDAHWGNGIAGSVPRFDRHNRHLADMERRGTWNKRSAYSSGAHSLDLGVLNLINASSVATEFEDHNRDQPWPKPMIDTGIRWYSWCYEEAARYGRPMPPIDPELLAGHFQIDAVNRPGCPGFYWPKGVMLAGMQAATGMGVDVLKPWNKSAKLGNSKPGGWVGSTWGPKVYRMNVRADFDLPAECRAVRMHVRLRKSTAPGAPQLVYANGAGGFVEELNLTDCRFATFDVIPDANGEIEFAVVGGMITFEVVDSTAYWTW